MKTQRSAGLWVDNAYALLIAAALFWGGNVIAVRLAVGQISPMMLGCLRWVVVFALLTPLVLRQGAGFMPAVRRHWRQFFWMGAVGLTVPNLFIYFAARSTSAVNLAIFIGATPAFVFLFAALWHRTGAQTLQIIGMLGTLVGVGVAATKGDVGNVLGFSWRLGDALVLIGCCFGAIFQVSLRDAPPLPTTVLLYVTAPIAFLTVLPLAVFEMIAMDGGWPTWQGWMIVGYVGIFPTLLSTLLMFRGIQLIGPGRASLFINLAPLFAIVFSVAILGEIIAPYHLLALGLVVGGIVLSEMMVRR